MSILIDDPNAMVRAAKRFAMTMENAKRNIERARYWRENREGSNSSFGFLNCAAYWRQEAAKVLQEIRTTGEQK